MELLLVEESNGSGELASQLTGALRSYQKLGGLPKQTQRQIDVSLGSLPTKTSNSSPSVFHSFGSNRDLLDQLGRYSSARLASSLTIVDPGFARSRYTELAKSLRKAFPEVTAVRVIGQETQAGDFLFPPEMSIAIEKAFYAKPTFRAVTGDRMLHAKALAWQGPAGSGTLTGSANLTVPGLLGRNLELSVVVEGTSLLNDLSTRQCTDAPNLRRRPDEQESGFPQMTAKGRVLGQDRKHRTLSATIEIEVHGRKPDWTSWGVEDLSGSTQRISRWSHDGRRLLVCRDREVVVDEDNWQVWVRHGTKSCAVPLDLSGHTSFDFDDLREVEDPLPPPLVELLAGIQSRVRSSTMASERTPKGSVDVLAQDDSSLVHQLTRALLSGGTSLTEEQVFGVLDGLKDAERLTSGEQWALRLLVATPTSRDDPLGHRIATTIGKIK